MDEASKEEFRKLLEIVRQLDILIPKIPDEPRRFLMLQYKLELVRQMAGLKHKKENVS